MDENELTTFGQLRDIRRQEQADALETEAAAASEKMRGGGDFTSAAQIALLLALGKDGFDWLIDFLIIGEIPVVGQIPGILLSALIWYYLKEHGLIQGKRGQGISAAGLIIDNLPIINNLPLGSMVVLALRRMADASAKNPQST